MKLEEAKERLNPFINKSFSLILSDDDMNDIIINKGKSGQLLEILLGLKNTSSKLDFEDGELKTNKCDEYGNPLETMFITQISVMFDNLISGQNFYLTSLYEKISNVLYVPICKIGEPKDWRLLPYKHINLNSDKDLARQLEQDYYSIIDQLKKHIETSSDNFIHTSNGKYIQIRSKDSKPYFPIFSKIFNREISNKNHAFYFKKDFMRYIVKK